MSSLLLCLLLTACAAGRIRDDGAVGNPGGRDGREHPGDLYMQLAVEYLRQGQTKTALSKAEHALAADPDNPQVHNLIALIYQRLGRNPLAERHFRAAIDLEPEDPYILNAYASFLCDRGRFAPARSRYEQALANPRYATPWVAMTNLGTCARQSGDLLPPGVERQSQVRIRHGRFGRLELQPWPLPVRRKLSEPLLQSGPTDTPGTLAGGSGRTQAARARAPMLKCCASITLTRRKLSGYKDRNLMSTYFIPAQEDDDITLGSADSPGEYLRATRQARGVTQDQVANG